MLEQFLERTEFKDYNGQPFYELDYTTANIISLMQRLNKDISNIELVDEYFLDKYCEEKGYIPVIDLCNNESIYLTKENVGKLNVWDMFFEQPAGYTLDMVSNAKNVIIGTGGYKYAGKINNGALPFDIFSDDKIDDWKPYCKKYIHFNDTVNENIILIAITIFPIIYVFIHKIF